MTLVCDSWTAVLGDNALNTLLACPAAPSQSLPPQQCLKHQATRVTVHAQQVQDIANCLLGPTSVRVDGRTAYLGQGSMHTEHKCLRSLVIAVCIAHWAYKRDCLSGPWGMPPGHHTSWWNSIMLMDRQPVLFTLDFPFWCWLMTLQGAAAGDRRISGVTQVWPRLRRPIGSGPRARYVESTAPFQLAH